MSDPLPSWRHSDRLALFSLVVSNLVLIVIAVFYQWSYFAPLVIFWLEIVIVGLYNVLKMFVVALAGDEPLGRSIGFENRLSAVGFTFILIVFFAVKFGGFLLGIGFLAILLPTFFDPEAGGHAVLEALDEAGPSIGIAVGVLIVSHGISFVRNFVAGREFRRANLLVLLIWPYVRGLCLYGTIIVGVLLGSSLPFADRSASFAIALVLIKLVVDIRSHLVERGRFGEGEMKKSNVSAQRVPFP